MGRKCLIGAAAAVSTLVSSTAIVCADTLEDVTARAALTTVYIDVEYVDHMTKDVKHTYGSGVVISAEGDVLTDRHVIADWLGDTTAEKTDHPIKVRIGSKFNEPPLPVTFETSDEGADIALLRIRTPKLYAAAPICYGEPLQSGNTIFAFGYPNNTELSPISGTFSNAGGDDNRWSAAIPFTHGMSGGPVYNSKGHVIGLVEEGIDSATNGITPLRWARPWIESRTSAKSSCFESCESPANGVASWGLSTPWNQDSITLGGGHSRPEVCSGLQSIYNQSHPGQFLELGTLTESSDKDFLGHVTYVYHCSGVVHSNPTYKKAPSPSCGIER